MIAINKEVWEKIREKAASYEMLFIDEVDGTASDIIYMNNVLSLDISKDNPLLITPLEVRNGKDIMKTFALWDTGATRTGVSMSAARRLSLEPTGKKQEILTANGTILADTAFLEIKMPDNTYKQFEVHIVPEQDNSISIGLDVIMCGRFVIEPTETGARRTFTLPPIRPV